jgi:hypothetical protein
VEVSIPCGYIPRYYQIPFLDAMDSGKRRAVLVWHRRGGKTKTVLNFTIKKAFERVGAYYHAFPEYGQGRKIIWDGIDKAGNKVLDLHIPLNIRQATNSTDMKITLLNGSIYQIIGADNYDSLVGPNPVGLILDEWAVSDRYPKAWDYFRPILAENRGWAVFPFTPRGRNHGWDLYQMALMNKDWFCQLLTIEDTNAISKADIQSERDSGMSEDMIQQEFYSSFLVGIHNILIAPELIQSALDNTATRSSGLRLAGGDCARFGDDRSTLVIRQGYVVIHAEFWRNLDNVQLANKFIERYQQGFYDVIGIDEIGMPGVYDIVKHSHVPCMAVNVSESPSRNENRYYRLRDELWWNVREFFTNRNCTISQGIQNDIRRELIKDVREVTYDYRPMTGQIVIERKDKMKKRLGYSPDLGDALCHTFMPGLEARAESTRTDHVDAYGSGIKSFRDDYNPLTYQLGVA